MKRSTKNFVDSAFLVGKDRHYIRKALYGRVLDVEVNSALRYFDKLLLKKSSKNRFNLLAIPKFIAYIIKFFFSLIVYLYLKVSLAIKKFFLGKGEEVDFEEVRESIGIAKFFRGIKEWFDKKDSSSKKRIIITTILILLLIALLIYSSFIFSKHCYNQTCFKTMVSECRRADFKSSDLVRLENRIIGPSLKGCKIKVVSLENELGIPPGKEMICYLPYGLRIMPSAKIEYCSGELREEIQTVLISELYKTVGQNTEKLNPFFKA